MVDAFNWILPRALAGSGRPGLLGDLDTQLAWLRSAGIEHVISLTEKPLVLEDRHGLVVTHFPIPDMGFPMPRRAHELCRFVLEAIQRDEPVLLHCKAGLGRTGTMLACCLVSRGANPDEAVRRVRTICSHYIQNQSQEMFVHHYGEFLRSLARAGDLAPPLRPQAEPDAGRQAEMTTSSDRNPL